MEIEVQTADREEKPALQTKLRQYKASLQQHKSDVVRLSRLGLRHRGLSR